MKAPHGLGKSAFTLIELLVVISIILFLAAVLVVAALQALPGAKEKRTRAALDNLAQALTDYYNEFQVYPPDNFTTSPPVGQEWWHYLTLTGGSGFQRPMRFDGTVRDQTFIDESKLNLPSSTGLRWPRDAWGSPIEYVYPVDNDAANLVALGDPSIPSAARQLTVAQAFYHCVLISPGKDKLSVLATHSVGAPRVTNLGAYESGAGNGDNVVKVISGH